MKNDGERDELLMHVRWQNHNRSRPCGKHRRANREGVPLLCGGASYPNGSARRRLSNIGHKRTRSRHQSSCVASASLFCISTQFQMQYCSFLKAQAGVRRLQQPQVVISSSSSRLTCRRKLLLPGQQQRYSRHVARSASAWNGAGGGSYYSAGNNAAAAAAGAAGNNGSSSNPSRASSQWQTNFNNSGFTPSPGSTWEEAAGSSGWQDFQNVDWGQTYQTGDWGEPGTVNGSQQQQQLGQQQFGAMPENTGSNFSGAYGSSSSSPNGFYSDYPHQQQQQSGDGGWPFAESRQRQQQQQPGGSSRGRPPMLPSDITLLGRRDAVSAAGFPLHLRCIPVLSCHPQPNATVHLGSTSSTTGACCTYS